VSYAAPFTLCAVLTLALSTGPHAWAAGSGNWIGAGPDLQRRLGVKTAPLKAEHRKSEVDAFAKVLDPEPLVQLDSDLRTAAAAAAASGAEAQRSAALHSAGAAVSAKDAETATAQARSDALHLSMLRRRVGLEWGPGLSRMSDAQRDQLVAALVAGKAALVHVDTPSNAGQAGAKTVKIDVGDDSVPGRVLGPARAAEPRLQSSGLIVEVTGPSAVLLSVGLTQSAHIDTSSTLQGVGLPREAIIRYRGSVWAFVSHDGNRFERRLVENAVPEEAGLFVPGGFAAGEQVVVQGAAGLFAAELGRPGGGAN